MVESETESEMSLPLYSREEDEIEEPPRKRAKKTNKNYLLHKTVKSTEEVRQFLTQEKCWSKVATNLSSKGTSEVYRCNKVKRASM